MLDASASMTQITLRPLPHVKVSDTAEMQTKFYRFEGLLGRGTFGTVMKATELKSGTKWAIKVINKAQSGASRIKLFQREISILRAVHHPHIIHLERVFESPKTLFLVFELCLGELRELFLKKKVFTEDETRKVVASLASAVSYLHRNDIVHRDLKLENILVSTNPSDPEDNLFIKVTDFGLSVVRGGVGHESMLQEMCGTPAYMSPELFGERMYSQQCDVWAMGVIMYLLLTGRYPFEAHSGRSLAQVVVGCEPNFNCEPFTTPAELAKEAEQKAQRQAGKDAPPPVTRTGLVGQVGPGAAQGAAGAGAQVKQVGQVEPAAAHAASFNTATILQEETSARKLLRKMLEKNPAYRATASEVEKDPWTRGATGDEPPSRNAMELMKMWRTEMRESIGGPAPQLPDTSDARRQSIRRLSYMLDAVRQSARVSDERARNVAIRRTFGELSPTSSVTMLLPPRGRRNSRSSGDSEGGRAPVARDEPTALAAPPGPHPSAGRGLSGAFPASSTPVGATRSVGRTVGGPTHAQRLSVIEEGQAVGKDVGPAPGQPGQFGVVGRVGTGETNETTSTANLMPPDRAPPIVYYNRSGAVARATVEVEAELQAELERARQHKDKRRAATVTGSAASGHNSAANGASAARGAIRRPAPNAAPGAAPAPATPSANIQLKARARANVKVNFNIQRTQSATGRRGSVTKR